MSLVPHILDSQDYDRWINSESASRLLDIQSTWLQHKITDMQGLQLMYQGISDDPSFIKYSPVSHCFRMGLPWQEPVIKADAWMDSSEWPLADCNLDVLIMQHSLDFTRRPHQMIREAARVVVPYGYLIIIGFNPYSLWGGAQKALPFSSTMPWVANPVSANRLKDWLTLLDFDIQSHETMGHLGLLSVLPRGFCQRFDSVMSGGAWAMGNYYMLVAQKKVAGMTRLRNRKWAMPRNSLDWASPVRHPGKANSEAES